MEYLEILVVIILPLFLFCYFLLHDKNGVPTNWPIIGMLPALLLNIHRFHDYFTEIMNKSQLTFHFKGPWFTNMYALATINPDNIHHVMSKNFGNYPKGSKFKEIFDVLGDGISNADSTVWQYHRKMIQSFLGHPKFRHLLVRKTWDKVDDGLIPLLDHVCKHGIEIDLQDLFARFMLDTICSIIMDHDPMSVSIDLPRIPSFDALNDIEEVIFYRHVVPPCVWKFQRWLGIGKENKYKRAWKILDNFVYNCLALIRGQKLSKGHPSNEQSEDNNKEVSTNLITLYLEDDENQSFSIGSQLGGDKFLRDTILNFVVAGRDTSSATLSWFFYLLSKNPQVLSTIKKELDNVMLNRTNFEEVNGKMIYLHGALCETLRLYPPVVLQSKTPIKPDILPSGHHVDPNTQVIFNLYAMGRMKTIWGDDCYEFKPERWISEQGKIRHEPSYKFLAFNAGPRTCVGKDMAFTQMKIVAATIIKNYIIEVMEGDSIVPDVSVMLHMKHGFKVKILHSQ